MKIKIDDLDHELILKQYQEIWSAKKIAEIHGCSQDTILKILHKFKAVLSRKEIAKIVTNRPEFKAKVSEKAKLRTGESNPFYGKTHNQNTKQVLSDSAKRRTGKRNPNYRHGEYKRRPKDYLISEFQPVRKQAFERDNYVCQFCNVRGGNLHAHHKIPYWVEKDAYLDLDNLITCCENCHIDKAHKGDYAKFNVQIISDKLVEKYKLDRERLNELADYNNKKSDAIV